MGIKPINGYGAGKAGPAAGGQDVVQRLPRTHGC